MENGEKDKEDQVERSLEPKKGNDYKIAILSDCLSVKRRVKNKQLNDLKL